MSSPSHTDRLNMSMISSRNKKRYIGAFNTSRKRNNRYTKRKTKKNGSNLRSNSSLLRPDYGRTQKSNLQIEELDDGTLGIISPTSKRIIRVGKVDKNKLKVEGETKVEGTFEDALQKTHNMEFERSLGSYNGDFLTCLKEPSVLEKHQTKQRGVEMFNMYIEEKNKLYRRQRKKRHIDRLKEKQAMAWSENRTLIMEDSAKQLNGVSTVPESRDSIVSLIPTRMVTPFDTLIQDVNKLEDNLNKEKKECRKIFKDSEPVKVKYTVNTLECGEEDKLVVKQEEVEVALLRESAWKYRSPSKVQEAHIKGLPYLKEKLDKRMEKRKGTAKFGRRGSMDEYLSDKVLPEAKEISLFSSNRKSLKPKPLKRRRKLSSDTVLAGPSKQFQVFEKQIQNTIHDLLLSKQRTIMEEIALREQQGREREQERERLSKINNVIKMLLNNRIGEVSKDLLSDIDETQKLLLLVEINRGMKSKTFQNTRQRIGLIRQLNNWAK